MGRKAGIPRRTERLENIIAILTHLHIHCKKTAYFLVFSLFMFLFLFVFVFMFLFVCVFVRKMPKPKPS